MLEIVLQGLARGMDLVAAVGGRSVADLRALGADDVMARRLHDLAAVYFGQTAFSRKQARAAGHSLGALEAIEAACRRVKRQSDKWRLRESLTAFRGSASQVAAEGRRLVAELKGPPKPPPAGVTIRRRNDDVYSMVVTGRSADIAPMFDAVKGADDPLAAVREIFHGERGGVQTVLTPMVVIPLDAAVKIASGDGEEVLLDLTNGARMTGAEVAAAALGQTEGVKFAEAGYVTLLHPVRGPVNLYHARFASEKQRLMAWAEHPRCAEEGCTRPAEESQIHHLYPWKYGGLTCSENLVTCCAYHNGINDDCPDEPPKRGRLARVGGKIKRVWGWAAPTVAGAGRNGHRQARSMGP